MTSDHKVEININDKLEISIDSRRRVSALVQEKENGLILISVPVYRGRPWLLDKGKSYEAIIFHDTRLFGFIIEVAGMVHEKIPMYKIRLQEYLGLVQRRGSVRAPVNFSFTFAAGETFVKESYRQDEYDAYLKKTKDLLHDGVVLDISAGGLNFSSIKRLEVGQPIRCFIDTPTLRLMCLARVVRKYYLDTKINAPINYGASFEGIDMRSEDKLVGFVFEMLRKNRKA